MTAPAQVLHVVAKSAGTMSPPPEAAKATKVAKLIIFSITTPCI